MTSDKINRWIKVVGISFILVSLLRFPLVIFLPQWFNRFGIDVLVIDIMLGYFLIRRAYWARIFGMVLGFGNIFAYWTYAHSLYVDRVPQVICYIHALFYACFFLFLVVPPVKQAFGPPLS